MSISLLNVIYGSFLSILPSIPYACHRLPSPPSPALTTFSLFPIAVFLSFTHSRDSSSSAVPITTMFTQNIVMLEPTNPIIILAARSFRIINTCTIHTTYVSRHYLNVDVHVSCSIRSQQSYPSTTWLGCFPEVSLLEELFLKISITVTAIADRIRI